MVYVPQRSPEQFKNGNSIPRLGGFEATRLFVERARRFRADLVMADGGTWRTPEFLALAAPRLRPQVGDVVRLRAGVDEGSRQGGPVRELHSRVGAASAASGRVDINCRP